MGNKKLIKKRKGEAIASLVLNLFFFIIGFIEKIIKINLIERGLRHFEEFVEFTKGNKIFYTLIKFNFC